MRERILFILLVIYGDSLRERERGRESFIYFIGNLW